MLSFALRSIFLSAVILQFAASQDYAKDTLKDQYGEILYAGLIFRHGNRVPEKFFPTDPNQNHSWPFELGQLVNEGKKRAFQLGKFFRPRYLHLVGKSYTPSKVVTHASSYDRTLMSGILFNAGFFPPSKEEIWNEELPWQPIPIHSTPASYDNVIRVSKPCPRYTQLRDDFYQKGETIKKICSEHKEAILYMEKHSGFKLTPCNSHQTILNLIYIQDALLVENQHKLPLPEWTKTVFPQPLNLFRDLLFFVEVDDLRIRKLLAGPLLNVFASDILNVAGLINTLPKNIYTSEPLKTPRLHLIAGHDINIIMMLKSLGVYTNEAPNYSAAISIEYRRKADKRYVTVLYENSLDEPPKLLHIPHCNGVCTLEKFLSLVVPFMPVNFEAECQLNYKEPTSNHTTTTSKKLSKRSSFPVDAPAVWSA